MNFKKQLSLVFIISIVLSSNIYAQQNTNKEHKSLAEWSKQSNIYEVNLRQFSSEGNLRGFIKQLPRLKKMGVEILWFMPVTPIGIKGRKMNESELGSYYAVRDYKGINPEFGNINEFKSVVRRAHSMGFKVITDWVANHSAIDNPWVTSHPDFYVKDAKGQFVSPYDWTDVLKLNYANRELRDSMIDAMQFWLKEVNIDGFRCDVAEDVAPDFWKECITSLRKTKDVFMLAEGNTPLIHEVGFDETYHWNAMNWLGYLYKGKINAKQFNDSINMSIDKFPKDAKRLFFTTNHDENSWNGTEFEKYGDAYKSFAVLSQTMYQSIPLVYNGQESENKKRLKFFVKDSIEWKDYSLKGFYETLLKLRRSNPALAADADYKKLPTSKDATIFAYTREKDSSKILVILNCSSIKQKFKISDKKINGAATNIFSQKEVLISSDDDITLAPWDFLLFEYKANKK